MKKGFFITLEGGEGAGKSTLQKTLVIRLRKAGYRVISTREPGGTRLGKRLRKELLRGGKVESVAELLLYAADRAQHVAEVIAPSLQSGAVVVCDRFSDSTVAYQGYGRKLNAKTIALLNNLAQQGISPNLTIWLDIAPAAGIERAGRRGTADRLEGEALAFHGRVRKGFQSIARREPKRMIRVDARLAPEAVFEEAWAVVDAKLKRVRRGL